VDRVFEEIENLKGTFISREWLGRIRDALLREHLDNSQENRYLLSEITRHYADGESPDVPPISNLPDLIGGLSADAIRDAARTYLKTTDYVKVVLMPAK
jgi:predicted Zn-dependent peptidase